MLRVTLAVFLSLALGLASSSAFAGIADSPLPNLGQPTLHLYSVPGVVDWLGIITLFACTSTDKAPVEVGVEVFNGPGLLVNDAVATSVTVAPGGSVLFGTNTSLGFLPDSVLGALGVTKGSARILATSKKLICTAFLADLVTAPPSSLAYLTIVKKTKQKAAN